MSSVQNERAAENGPLRERIVAKDLMNLFGYGQATAYRKLKAIKQEAGTPGPHLLVDDVSKVMGLTRQRIKERMVA